MIDRIEQRLDELQQELKRGNRVLTELDQSRVQLANTLQRIVGAIQVLEELQTSDDLTEQQK